MKHHSIRTENLFPLWTKIAHKSHLHKIIHFLSYFQCAHNNINNNNIKWILRKHKTVIIFGIHTYIIQLPFLFHKRKNNKYKQKKQWNKSNNNTNNNTLEWYWFSMSFPFSFFSTWFIFSLLLWIYNIICYIKWYDTNHFRFFSVLFPSNI